MSEWTAGYVADIGYTYGYYPELNPLRIKLAFLSQGLAFPEVGSACELGFGQGLSANMHATASVAQWHGTDFNPSQAAFAQELAMAAGANARLYDDAFADFVARPDLPQFDFIAMHGIWSWISDENRQIIVEFIRAKLKVGGVLYISYNTLPGWAAFAPMRHLLTLHADIQGAEGQGILGRIDGAFDFVDQLLTVNPGYARANTTVPDRVKKVKGQNRNYLAHEYFNRDWLPMHYATMAKWLEPAKLQYACSANYLDHVDAVNLTAEQQTMLKGINDVTLRETTRDFIVNQQFRRDYWVKGARKLSPLAQADAFRAQRVVLATPRPDISLKVGSPLGEASMSEAIYTPILDFLSDHKVRTLGQIEQAVKDMGINFLQIVQAMQVLISGGHLAAAQDEAAIVKARKHTDRLNAYIMNKSRGSSDVTCLASPVTGGGIEVARFHQLFLLAIGAGKKQPTDWADFSWQTLQSQGQAIMKDGSALQTVAENIAELVEQAEQFQKKRLPILRALMVV
jgi:SAM-dependent methyltransferase